MAQKAESNAFWGNQTDPAWVLRRAFEAIKEGAHSRHEYDNSGNGFWDRIVDRESFRPQCLQ